MRIALVPVVAVFAALLAVPAFAGDGHVPRQTLASLGLSGLQGMSDADGMQVRGRSSGFAMVMGTTVIFGQLVSPDTKNFLLGSDVNMVMGNAETTNALSQAIASKNHASSIAFNLDVLSDPPPFAFSGAMSGIVGGTGVAIGDP